MVQNTSFPDPTTLRVSFIT